MKMPFTFFGKKIHSKELLMSKISYKVIIANFFRLQMRLAILRECAWEPISKINSPSGSRAEANLL